jgi:uncharacterized protein
MRKLRRLSMAGLLLAQISMQAKTLHDDGQQRTVALVFETGERVMETLLAYAGRERLGAGHFTAIGALRRVTLGYFEWERRDYRRIEVGEQVEVLSLVGDIALEGTEPRVHAHVVVGRSDGTAMGGHLIEGEVRPTLELVLVEPPAHLRRRFDPESRLALLRA